MEMVEKLKKANDVLKIQAAEGNWNYSAYMRGMYNGMELIVSIFEDREPQYKEASKDETGPSSPLTFPTEPT